MNLRTHLTLWYGAVLLLCIGIAVAPIYDELLLDASPYPQLDPREGWHHFRVILRGMLLEALPLVSIGLIGGWFLTGRALRQLKRVIDAAEQLDTHTLGQRLQHEKCDADVARLVQVFNVMAARLEGSFLRIREFMLHASHELNTPLAIMRGDMETCLLTWNHLTEEQRAKLAIHIDEIDRLTRIVEGLFLLAKADSGMLDIAHEPVHFEELVDDMAEATEILGATSDIAVTLRQRESCVVLGDRARLRQMMLNLADNAIKYNEAGGWVDIALQREPLELVLSVSNSGPGMPPENQHKVFERFYRGPGNGGNVEGCGLGLNIAQSIIQVHHGSIEFKSRPGHTQVDVRLPLYVEKCQHDDTVIPARGIPSSG